MEEWTIWQLVDSTIPTGGFAHSVGLEAAVAMGHIDTEATRVSKGYGDFHHGHEKKELRSGKKMTLLEFIQGQVESLAALELPFVYEAHQDPSQWARLDQVLAVRLHVNPSAFKASTAQGIAFARISNSGLVSDPQGVALARQILDSILAEQSPGNLSPIFGAMCRFLGISAERAQKIFLFMSMRDMISAARRLALIGSFASVQLQTQLSQHASVSFDKYKNKSVDDAHQTFPVGDLLHSCHGSLFRKLFLT